MGRKLHIFIGGVQNEDYLFLQKVAGTPRQSRWSSTKAAQRGDRVLIYIAAPHSALIAQAVVTKAAWKGKPGDWPYLCRIGQIRRLPNRVSLAELKREFPRWKWLAMPRGKTTVPDQYAERLWKLVHQPPATTTDAAGAGAGFGDAETNRLVERAAVRKVTRSLERKGYYVRSRERDKVGYDLEATKADSILHVEVKGVSGPGRKFTITANELETAKKDPHFQLIVVTNARSNKARLWPYSGKELSRKFLIRPQNYRAEPK